MTSMVRVLALSVLTAAVTVGWASTAHAVRIFGLSAEGHVLVHFNSADPSAILRTETLRGLQPGERLVGIDVRPASGQLYGVGIVSGATDTGRLYRIDPFTGAATPVGSGPFATDLLPATAYGIDFNPVVDRLRIVNAAGENLRVNPATGARADSPSNDTNLNGASTGLVAVAYDHDVPGATLTTLFGIDSTTDMLVRVGGIDGIPSPNGGTVSNVGPLGVNAIGDAGFDIDAQGTLFAALTVAGQSRLYLVNPTTGAATLIGPIGDGNLALGGLAVAPAASVTISPASGLLSAPQRFDVVIFFDLAGLGVANTLITLDGADVTAAFVGCAVPGIRPTGGTTARCGIIPASLLGLGSHTGTVTVTLSNGTVATASETWTVVPVTE
jgi:hypothetical protein